MGPLEIGGQRSTPHVGAPAEESIQNRTANSLSSALPSNLSRQIVAAGVPEDVSTKSREEPPAQIAYFPDADAVTVRNDGADLSCSASRYRAAGVRVGEMRIGDAFASALGGYESSSTALCRGSLK